MVFDAKCCHVMCNNKALVQGTCEGKSLYKLLGDPCTMEYANVAQVTHTGMTQSMKMTDAPTTKTLYKTSIRQTQVSQRRNQEMQVMMITSPAILVTATVTSVNQGPYIHNEKKRRGV